MGTDIESRESIQRVKPGDEVRASLMNALVDFVAGSENPGFPYGYDENTGTTQRKGPTKRSELWVPCTSDDSADPFSILEVYGATLDDSMTLYTKLRKATASAKMYAANEAYPLISGDTTWCKLITPYEYCCVNVSYGSNPAWLDELGVSGFNVTSSNSGQLICVGQKNPGGQVAVVSPVGSLILIGQTTVSHSKGATQTVNIFRGSTKGSETFTSGDTVQAYLRFGGPISAGKWVAVAFINNGWEIICAEC